MADSLIVYPASTGKAAPRGAASKPGVPLVWPPPAKKPPQPVDAAVPAVTDPRPGAPESYADFILPDGMSADAKMSEDFTALAREMNLPQDQAQKLVDLYAGYLRDMTDEPVRNQQETQAQWARAARADREYGGLRFDKNIAIAARAIDRFGGQPLRQALEVTGAGNHPEVIRFLYRVGKAMSEDSMASSYSAARSRDPAEILYPSMRKE